MCYNFTDEMCVFIFLLEYILLFRFTKNIGGAASPTNKQAFAQQEHHNQRAFIRKNSFSDDATDTSG